MTTKKVSDRLCFAALFVVVTIIVLFTFWHCKQSIVAIVKEENPIGHVVRSGGDRITGRKSAVNESSP